LAECARASSLFRNVRVEVIPNGVDTDRFRPLDRRTARELLGLPIEKTLVLFAAWQVGNPWKGFDILQEVLQKLSETSWKSRMELVLFGASPPPLARTLDMRSHYLGRLNDTISMALAYSAADVFLSPSIRDNLPTMVMESIACGVPTVAFRVGGLPDLIEHKVNGYLANAYDPDDFARGVVWVLDDQERYDRLSRRAREKAVEEFPLESYARRYLDLYREVLEAS
jgi:glycosyltransferase involved in cell wall biosynthesis